MKQIPIFASLEITANFRRGSHKKKVAGRLNRTIVTYALGFATGNDSRKKDLQLMSFCST